MHATGLQGWRREWGRRGGGGGGWEKGREAGRKTTTEEGRRGERGIIRIINVIATYTM
jgi:hypothetical protein